MQEWWTKLYGISQSADFASGVRVILRPINKASVVKVPCSASNLSSNGVSVTKFRKAWRNPACIRGNVFVLYTVDAT